MPVPRKPIGHFLGWFIIPLIIFHLLDAVLYWYAVIGSLLVLTIYYLAFFGKKWVLPAIGGWILAFVISYWMW